MVSLTSRLIYRLKDGNGCTVALHGIQMPPVTFRNTLTTLLLYGGVDIKTVQSRLGHGSLDVTNQYLHLVQDADVAAANILDTMLTITKTDGLQKAKDA